MQRYIDEASILSEARIMYHDCHETYILVEGESDKTFFLTLMSPPSNIRFRAVNGWERVHNTINLAKKESFTPIAGIIDRDYHSLLQDGVEESEQLFFTDSNDIEMMLFSSNAFDKFLAICAEDSKISNYDSPRHLVIKAASCIGALRVISLINLYHFHFDGFECKDFINRNTLSPDCAKLIEKITQRSRSKGTQVTVTNEVLNTQIEVILQQYSLDSLCNGHDVLDILSIAMSKLFASSSSKQYNANELFNYLLMGYTTEEFQDSQLFKSLNRWMIASSNA